MNITPTPIKYLLLYIPWFISIFFLSDPVVSFIVAWLGSFYIFFVSFTNKIKDTSGNEPITEKILRPLFLMQFIFAAYTCCTSIFYFLDQLGYVYTDKVPYRIVSIAELKYTASCQRYYVLGHAALAHGLLLFYKKDIKDRYKLVVTNWPAFFARMAIICIPLSFIFQSVSGLSQFSSAAQGLAFVAATLSFAIAIPQKKIPIILLAGSLYGFQLLRALASGFKEPVIVSVLMVGIFLYPFYKRTIIVVFVPLLIFLFTVLPTYVETFRKQNWGNKQNVEGAQNQAISKVKEDLSGENLKRTNWVFLTTRISEIEMFVKYKKAMDKRKSFYGLQIVEQSLFSIVPRIFWPGKPVTETLAMERAYENGVIDRIAVVSAKPAFIVDGFLSGGTIGVWLSMFLYGIIAQLINNKAEQLFGGYLLGTVLIFTSLFRSMWRGDCFEFIIGSIFWSFISMLIVFHLLKIAGVLLPLNNDKLSEKADSINKNLLFQRE